MRIDAGVFAAALIAVVVGAAPAAAQTARPKVAVSVGVGEANPLPIDLPFTARTWTAAVDVVTGRHVTIQGVASGWRHATTSSFDANLTSRAGNTFVVTPTMLTENSRSATFDVSLNALATIDIGRVRLSSGAGGGFSRVSTELTDTATGCASSVPQSCQVYSSRFTVSASAVQCVLGADVTLTRRLRAFVAYRLSQPFTAPLADISVVAGVKVGVR